MGKKDLKTRTQFTNTLNNDLYAQIKEVSKHTSIPVSKLLDRSVEKLLEDESYSKYLSDK